MVGLVKVRFTHDAVYRVHGYAHPDNPVFKAGTDHELSDDLAQRWIKRGVAEKVTLKSGKEDKDGHTSSATKAEPAPKADGDDSGGKPPADDDGKGKTVSRGRGR